MQSIEKIKKLEQKLVDDGEGIKPEPQSVLCFLTFSGLLKEVVIKEMILSLTPENNIYGSWSVNNLRFGIHFKEDNTVKMVMIKRR